MWYNKRMDKQTSMSFFTDELAEVKTHKKEFLSQMEQLIPWDEWAAMIKPCYYKGERGNKPYDLELMLRIYVLQIWPSRWRTSFWLHDPPSRLDWGSLHTEGYR